MDRQFKRTSDREPSEGAKRQMVEFHASDGFASGSAGRRHLLFMNTTRETYDQAGTSDYRRSLDQASPSRPLTESEQLKQRQAILAQQLAMLARLDKIAEQGQTNSSDQVQKVARSNKRQEINFAPLASPLHEQQQQSKENDRDLLEAHGPRRDAPIQSSTHHSSDAPFQKHPLDNLRQQDFIEQRQHIAVQQHEMHDQASPSPQGDAPNKISPFDFDTPPDKSHEQQQHDKGKSTMIPELKEYLMRSLADNSASQTYIDGLSKYLSNLPKEEQIEYLKRSRAVDPAFDYFSRLSGKDKKAFHDFYKYINQVVKENKMDRNVAINVATKWFPRGYQLSKQWQKEMGRSENISDS